MVKIMSDIFDSNMNEIRENEVTNTQLKEIMSKFSDDITIKRAYYFNQLNPQDDPSILFLEDPLSHLWEIRHSSEEFFKIRLELIERKQDRCEYQIVVINEYDNHWGYIFEYKISDKKHIPAESPEYYERAKACLNL